jgi:hypothetical protein
MQRHQNEQQNELVRYLTDLNIWLAKDVTNRQTELQGVENRIAHLQDAIAGRAPLHMPGLCHLYIQFSNIDFIPRVIQLQFQLHRYTLLDSRRNLFIQVPLIDMLQWFSEIRTKMMSIYRHLLLEDGKDRHMVLPPVHIINRL